MYFSFQKYPFLSQLEQRFFRAETWQFSEFHCFLLVGLELEFVENASVSIINLNNFFEVKDENAEKNLRFIIVSDSRLRLGLAFKTIQCSCWRRMCSKVERKEELVSPVERLWRSSLTTGRVDWSRLDSET